MCRGSGGSRGLGMSSSTEGAAGGCVQVLPCLHASLHSREHPPTWPGTLATGNLKFALPLGVSSPQSCQRGLKIARKKTQPKTLHGERHEETMAEWSPVPKHLVLPPRICK